MLAKLERVEAVRPDSPQGNFQMQKVERAGTHVLTAKEAAVGYPGTLLASGINFILNRGECLGIIGPNGSGKTTFLKTVLGKLPQLDGEIRWGSNVTIGYYAQQLDDLDERNEIIMELRRVAPSSATAGELRGFLARFLFTGDDVYKHVRDLSGGEKGRLALAKLIYSRVNVLVLDEPTNHLDIPSREALEEALDAYDGTIVTISHDRYFLDRVATQILALDGEGHAEHYDGDYTEYHDWKAARRANEAERLKASASKPAQEVKSKAGGDVKSGVDSSRAASKPEGSGGGQKKSKKKRSERDPQAVEAEVADAEKRFAALAEELASPAAARDPALLARLNEEYAKADERLRSLYEEWERVVAKATNA
jgi:ATP-binding cassette subfamily F protein 3